MKHIRRMLALLLSMSMLLGFVSVARAEGTLEASCSGAVFTENEGTVAFNIQVSNKTSEKITVLSVAPTVDGLFAGVTLGKTVEIDVNGSQLIPATGILRPGADKNANKTLTVYATSDSGPKIATCNDYSVLITSVTTPQSTPAPESTPDPEAKLRLSPVDANGLLVPAPEGDYGEAISVRIPLLCQRSSVYDLKITPALSNDIEKFPFDIEAVDYMLTYPNSLQPGNIVEFTYNFRLSKKATTGVKQVDFNLSYRTGAAYRHSSCDTKIC